MSEDEWQVLARALGEASKTILLSYAAAITTALIL